MLRIYKDHQHQTHKNFYNINMNKYILDSQNESMKKMILKKVILKKVNSKSYGNVLELIHSTSGSPSNFNIYFCGFLILSTLSSYFYSFFSKIKK